MLAREPRRNLWPLRRTSHFVLETGQRSAAPCGRRRATSIWVVRGLACRNRERKVPPQHSIITRHAGKVVAPSNAAREPGGSCNQQENIMPTRKSGARGPARSKSPGKAKSSRQSDTALGSTVSGPSRPGHPDTELAEHAVEQAALAEAMPFNAAKSSEYAPADPSQPPEGAHEELPSPSAGASTLSESNASAKSGAATLEPHTLDGSLASKRVNSAGQALTTNQGVAISNNQDSLKAGLRGPTLLEDFVLREKITHFDHERIPERIVHARGTGAHGTFQPTKSLAKYTRAAFLQDPKKKTEVFVRFSTVAGGAGSGDMPRDVRGFAVKFYTEEGNFDLVGNNIPVFFIQDAIKFPDFVHAVKPEPHNEMPQGGSAHDTFWDFVSLVPESAHMVLWTMSDRAIPRSLRTMEGFGIHTFRLVNAEGHGRFVKFHWRPTIGSASLLWDEAQKLAGKDADFHRHDLWEAIDMGDYPEWELGVQIVEEDQEHSFDFDILDPTKIIPEE